MAERSDRGPLLVILDDLQWADPLTLFGLPALASRLAGQRVGWLLARRPFPHPPVVERSAAALSSVGTKVLAPRLLSAGHTAEWAADLMKSRPGDALMKRLGAASGNPLLVLQLLRAARLPGDARYPTLAPRVLDRLLTDLPADACRVIELASALGRRFALTDLADLAGLGPGAAADVVAELVCGGLFMSEEPWLSFRHELVREALGDRISPSVQLAASRALSRRTHPEDVSRAKAEGAGFGWATLTGKELRVARLVAQGLTNREVAARLSLSPHTVDYHLKHAFAKLGVHSRTSLARIVLAQDLNADPAR
jgi:DNA-binding CsgD family transcriptional regulator